MLREAARVLAEQNRVVIVDTSNEIGGDGDIPHPSVGRARRMQVAEPVLQHEVMIEAVENHMPEVIIIDEIGRELEALAATGLPCRTPGPAQRLRCAGAAETFLDQRRSRLHVRAPRRMHCQGPHPLTCP